jgi:ubiquinone/menaquinone biosynthesis C-methylase UbiE
MPDPYLDPDRQPDAVLEAMITRLEERARHPGFAGMIANHVDSLPCDRPLVVLDLGCGTGVVTRRLAERLHRGSVVRGADVSLGLLRAAERLSRGGGAVWDHLAPGPLPYPDGTFDAVTMHTLLSHVQDPSAVLRECRRVLKRDGRLIVFDADHAGTTYGQPDYETSRRIDHLLTSAIATHPDICRRMPRLLKAGGFRLDAHRAEVISECGRGDYWLSSVRGFARLMPSIGALAPAEADAWVAHMLESHDSGTFFAAGAFYTFYAVPAVAQAD